MPDMETLVRDMVAVGFAEYDAATLIAEHGGPTYVGKWLQRAIAQGNIRNIPAFVASMVRKQAPIPISSREARESGDVGRKRYFCSSPISCIFCGNKPRLPGDECCDFCKPREYWL
jgi:hypothetical protein